VPTAPPAPPPPATLPEQEEVVERRSQVLPPWNVLLHNDDHNDMLHVVLSLLKSVPKLSRARAVEIMLEAHTRGKALVITCPLELAELYRDRLQSFGLTATIEKC
jgi:ATP-dependent Clp protease adaptor protein ClpS